MNKQRIYQRLIVALERTHQGAIDAAQRAYNTATDNENIAENKYDTLALEASYLAQGQSQRVEECAMDLAAFQQLPIRSLSPSASVCLGALVELHDIDENRQLVFLGPSAGGLKVQDDGHEIVVVTPNSPLGAAINRQSIGDEVSILIADKLMEYEITAIY